MRRGLGKASPQGSGRTVVHFIGSQQLFGLTTRICTHVEEKKKSYLGDFRFKSRICETRFCVRKSIYTLRIMKGGLHMFWNTERKELRRTLKCTLLRTLLLVDGQRINDFFWHIIHIQFKIFQYQIYWHSILTKWYDNLPCIRALWHDCSLSF